MLCHHIRLRDVRRKSTPSRQAFSEQHNVQLHNTRNCIAQQQTMHGQVLVTTQTNMLLQHGLQLFV